MEMFIIVTSKFYQEINRYILNSKLKKPKYYKVQYIPILFSCRLRIALRFDN